ncbi:MAG: OsmC family protein [Halomonadaceae bacterium]|nr:MAG: OsmC family protein [Halomonadaceae bacterium]
MSSIQFTSRQGLSLNGTLELPPGGEWRATALFAHCFTCSSDLRAARTLSQSLVNAGFAVLRFDFTGLGESEGDFADTDFSSNLDDLEDAALWLEHHYAAPQLLLGHSLGGTAVLAVAERLPSVKAVATLAAPAQPEHVLKQFGDNIERIEQQGSAEVDLGGRNFRIRNDFIEDARSHDLSDRMRKLRRALLVMHSPTDNIVAVSNATDIFTAALHPKSFVSLDDADHLLSRRADAEYAGQVVAAWAGRFLSSAKAEKVQGARVSGVTEQGFLCRVQTGQHQLIADEPRSVGGTDQGPDPYAQLSSALATCTVMTLNMYARHKKLKVERVICEVSHSKVHVEDCEHCDSSEGKVDALSRKISIEGDLTEQERERMMAIANRCPVHRTLESQIHLPAPEVG